MDRFSSIPDRRHTFPDMGEPAGELKAVIDLPQVPSSVGREQSFANGPIIAHRMQGDVVQGLLQQFDPMNNLLVLTLANKRRISIAFADLRFLVFCRPLLPPGENAAAPDFPAQQARSSVTHTANAFELVFTDNRKFHATAETVITERSGLHIFVDKPDGHIYRVFVPKLTIKTYNFDTRLGMGLVEHREVSTKHKEPTPQLVHHRAIDGATKSSPYSVPGPVTNTEQLREALAQRWPLPPQRLGELLIAQHLVTEDQVRNAFLTQLHHPGTYIGEILLEQGVVEADDIYSTLAYKLGFPFVKLENFDIDPRALSYFPRDLAVRNHIMPLFLNNGLLVVAMSNPTDSEASKMAEFITDHRIEISVATPEDVELAIDKNYRRREDDEVFESIEQIDDQNEEDDLGTIREAERLSNEQPIVRLVHNMIIDAVRGKASDIHIRPGEKNVELLLRIDGSLVNMHNFSKAIHAAVVSRIKIIGRMDISERRVPQDGRANLKIHGNAVDLRISIMPTINGESVVIRILDTTAGLRGVDELGFGERDHRLFKDMISNSTGILLVTGPTGSGKSTTLYAALEHIRKSNVNILTAEDPVEYHIDGIEQMQVNHKIGYTFDRILRNMLRHDPDVIMVGEIRDKETAKIAIESALTGHLVLSTLHTNSAAVTITRLLEMGIEPYLINDTLLGVLAQRLVRVNCPHCIEPETGNTSFYETLGVDKSEKFYRGVGCEKCNHTGYKGRMAVYELLEMSMATRAHISRGVSADIIHSQAVTDGMVPLTQNALEAARSKKTSLAEVYRVRLS